MKTRESIRTAFFDLLAERGFDCMTVAEIARRARVGKGTFYYHYTDKYDLADKLAQAELEAYREVVRTALSIGGDGNLQVGDVLRGEAMAISREMGLLLSIRTAELDIRARFNSLLEGFYRELIDESPALGVRDSGAVAALFAANALVQMERVASGENALDLPSMQRNLTDFIACLRYFYSLP